MKTKNFILNTSSGRGSLVCLVLMLVLVLLCPSDGSCQILGNSYTWQDTIVISGTAIDTSWSSRIPTLINAGDIFVIDDGKKLRRAKFWTEKKTSQY